MPVLVRTTQYTSKIDIAVALGMTGSALALLAGEAQGFALNATTPGGALAVIDTGTPANNKNDVLLNSSNLIQSGTSPKVVVWNDGTLHTIGIGLFAQQFDGTRFGLLVEPAATNLVLHSQALDNAVWAKSNATITADAVTAPDGTLTADSLVEDTSTTSHLMNQAITVVASTDYTLSLYIRAGTGSARNLEFGVGGGGNGVFSGIFDPNTGTFDGPAGSFGGATVYPQTATLVGLGWYRLTIGFQLTTTTAAPYISLQEPPATQVYLGDGVSNLPPWGWQLELGRVATSYIVTGATAVTRTADIISCATSTYPHSATEGTFIFWVGSREINEATANRLFALNDGTANEEISLVKVIGDAPDSFGLNVIDGGVGQVVATVTKAGSVSLAGNKVACVYKLNDCAILAAGGSEVGDATATMPTVTAFNLGHDLVAGRQLNGYIYQMTYVPRRMTTVEMQTRTV